MRMTISGCLDPGNPDDLAPRRLWPSRCPQTVLAASQNSVRHACNTPLASAGLSGSTATLAKRKEKARPSPWARVLPGNASRKARARAGPPSAKGTKYMRKYILWGGGGGQYGSQGRRRTGTGKGRTATTERRSGTVRRCWAEKMGRPRGDASLRISCFLALSVRHPPPSFPASRSLQQGRLPGKHGTAHRLSSSVTVS